MGAKGLTRCMPQSPATDGSPRPMQTPIRVFVDFTLLLRDAPMSADAKASALIHLQDLADNHRSPSFCRRLDDFLMRFSEGDELRTRLEPLVSALKTLQSPWPDPATNVLADELGK